MDSDVATVVARPMAFETQRWGKTAAAAAAATTAAAAAATACTIVSIW